MKTIFHGKIWTIPNLLSFVRILMIPWFLRVYLSKGDSLAAAVILLLSGITDTMDGVIARRFNMVSNLGKALDPVADKLTQIAVMACLVFRFPHVWLLLGALCIKELFVLASSLMAIHHMGEVLPADWHGKVTTTALYAAMAAHLLFPSVPGALSDAMILLCTAMILLSGVLYGRRNIRAIRTADADRKAEDGLVKTND